MLRLKNLTNKYQKRLIRPIYANTQATPYAAVLDSQTLTGPAAGTGVTSFRDGTGSIRVPASGDTSPVGTRTAAAYTLKNSLVPGLVLVRTVAEQVAVASGANTTEQPFGLSANFVGGDLDDGYNGDSLQNQIGAWRGPDAVFELIAPAFNDAGGFTNQQSLTAALAGQTAGVPILLYGGPDGRLASYSTPGSRVAVARLIDRPSASRILIDLLI